MPVDHTENPPFGGSFMKTHKEKLRVIILTANHQIKGEVHLYENSRLTDILNADTATKDFLPVTDAEITDLRHNSRREVSFLSINRNHVEVVMEDDEAIAISKAREALARSRYVDALGFAQRAVKVNPSDPEALYLLGFCQAKNKDPKAARATFERCLALKPNAEIIHKVQEVLGTLVG